MPEEPLVIEYAAEVLSNVLAEHGIERKMLAMESGISVSSISRMLSGEQRVVVQLLVTALRLTDDRRLIHVLAGDRPDDILHASATRPTRTPPASNLFPCVCESVRQSATSVECVGRILANGRIDVGDKPHVEQCRDSAAIAMRKLSQVVAWCEGYLQQPGVIS